jgi:AcrR family transcriptional regulator
MRREVSVERVPLSVSAIVSTAIELADGGGLDAVSMRQIGQRLGATGMALYRHVANRDELLTLMVDTVIGEFAYPEPRPEHWRDALTELARQDWRSYFAHPWLLAVTATSRPPMGPNMLTAMEWALTSFDGLDLAAHEQLYLLTTVISYTQGLALTWNRQEPEDTTDWWREQVAEAGGHPRLRAVTEGYRHPSLDLDEEFEFGLERVLDGLAVYLEKRQ